LSSSFGSNTLTVSKVSADNSSTIVVIPEVMRGQWSPCTISGFSPNVSTVSVSTNSEF
jgi:hypothetical protein